MLDTIRPGAPYPTAIRRLLELHLHGKTEVGTHGAQHVPISIAHGASSTLGL